jgi:hypothetical protein
MLSEIDASLEALAFNPATPAASEEEIVMGKRLSAASDPDLRLTLRFRRLTSA